MNAEQLAGLVSIATVSLLHTLLPSHWLCFALVGRAQKWSLRRTLGVTAIAGTCHVAATVILGILAVRVGGTLIPEESQGVVSAGILIGMGSIFLLLHLFQKGHTHEHDLDRMAIFTLILLPTVSPCTAVIPLFPIVAHGGTLFFVLMASVLMVTTLGVMMLLVSLSSLGVDRMRFTFVDRYEKALVGGILCILGLFVFAMHRLGH